MQECVFSLVDLGGAEIVHEAQGLPDALDDPPYLGREAKLACNNNRVDAADNSAPWWRRPVAIEDRPCGKTKAELEESGYQVMSSLWVFNCISAMELLPPD